MPIYIYKAATKNGQVVRNRVEEVNRFILLRRLKIIIFYQYLLRK